MQGSTININVSIITIAQRIITFADPQICSVKGFNEANTTEVYAGISAGLFSVKYSYAVTDLFGIEDSDGSSYLEAGIDYGFAETWSVGAHVGKQFISGEYGEDYIDWSVGLSKSLPGDFSIDLKYVDTDVDGADSTVFAALTKSF